MAYFSMDQEAAATFVDHHGTPFERARLAVLRSGHSPEDVPPELLALQNDDGGFPYALQPGAASTLYHTATVLQWLYHLHLETAAATGGAIAFLQSCQSPRGIWRERREVQ